MCINFVQKINDALFLIILLPDRLPDIKQAIRRSPENAHTERTLPLRQHCGDLGDRLGPRDNGAARMPMFILPNAFDRGRLRPARSPHLHGRRFKKSQPLHFRTRQHRVSDMPHMRRLCGGIYARQRRRVRQRDGEHSRHPRRDYDPAGPSLPVGRKFGGTTNTATGHVDTGAPNSAIAVA